MRSESPTPSDHPPGRSGTARVLLIEDNSGDALLMQEWVSSVAGDLFTMDWAELLGTGLAKLKGDGFDLIVLDLTLPDSSGWDTFVQARECAPHVPLLVLSGLDDEALALKTVQEGAQDYLVKGRVDADVLVRAMRYAIERGRAEKALAEERNLLREATTRLRNFAAQLTSAEQRERKRLAALLHDDLQQLLVAATMRLDSVGKRVRDDGLQQELAQVADWIGEASAAARDLTHQLRPPALYEDGLVAALGWLASQIRERHELEVEIRNPDTLQPMRDDLKALLFDCTRELLFNVVKYARVNRATVSLFEDHSCLRVIVEDKGKGFDVGAKAGEASSESFGLFSIRERLRALEGEMTIDSVIGRGTRTELTVPLPVVAAVEPAGIRGREFLQEPPLGEVAAAVSGRRPVARVLVVDDHTMVRQGIANILRKDGRIVVVGEAADGIEAIEAMEQKHPNVVLMDLNMPRMNGIEATREIHRRWPEAVVVGLSVQDDEATAKSMLAAGAEAFLPKSGDADRMIATIMKLAEQPGKNS